MTKIQLLPHEILPIWFQYPPDFINSVNNEIRDIGQWQILEGNWLQIRFEGMKKRFPDLNLVPFARRLDNDDIACWESRSYPAVKVIHDFCDPEWAERKIYPSFYDWMEDANAEIDEQP